MKIAFWGSRGAYTEAASSAIFDYDILTMPHSSYDQIFGALDDGSVDLAMVPYNTSRVGIVPGVLHYLREREIYIQYEIKISTAFVLAALPGGDESKVKRILADPMALVYCSQYVQSRSDLAYEPIFNSETTFKRLIDDQDSGEATFCSKFGASIFGLEALKENCNDNPDAWTTYIGIGKTPLEPEAKDKTPSTMITFDLAHEPGALLRSLKVFSKHEINLTSLEARPTDQKTDRFSFFATFDGLFSDKKTVETLEELEGNTDYVRHVGSYVYQEAE